MKGIPKWKVSIQYPRNVTEVLIGLVRDGYEEQQEFTSCIAIGDSKEDRIRKEIEEKVALYERKCDDLNHKISLANRVLKERGYVDV